MGRGPRPDLAERNRARANRDAPRYRWPGEHKTWEGMILRCHCATNRDYPKWGGRGISVCDRWRGSFAAFLADMGPKPGPGYSIERRNNHGNYEPGNCVWATPTDQARNRRSNVHLTHDGETLLLVEWAQRTGIGRATIAYRVKAGWPVDEALTWPVDKANRWRR